ncbi:MAG: hypothetical protein M3O55_07425 [Actinomycetota bacterium]|nr:hypothetical protein [Actinomycetota bacterium]
MISVQLAHHYVVTLAPSGGILDWGNGKVTELGTFFRGFSIVGGIGFVIFQALASRGAFSRIIISGLAAAVFIWIVWNVTDLRDRVGNELKTAPAYVQLHNAHLR